MSERENTSMQDLAAAYALGALSPEETRAFEAFLQTSPETQREVDEYREVSAVLSTLARGPAPDPELKDRVMNRIGQTRVASLPRSDLRASRPSMPLWIALAASTVLAVGLGAALLSTRRELASSNAARDSVRSALALVEGQLQQREKTLNWILEPGVQLSQLNSTGTAEPKIQFFWNRQKNIGMVHAFNLGPATAGKVYQLWFIKDGKPVPSVTFNAEPDGHAMVENITVPQGSGITHAAVTIEPAGGSPAPTSPIVMMGTLGSS
jgi:anti-sigma-K factor RskA